MVQLLRDRTDAQTPVAWDTETTALEPRDAALVGIGCCWGSDPEAVAYIPIGHSQGQCLDLQMVLDSLRPILESDRHPKALQNAKFDRAVLRHQGITLAGVVFDPMLASYILDSEGTYNLTYLSQKYLGILAQSYKDLVPKGKTIAEVDIASVADYCGMDVHTTFRLVGELRSALQQVGDRLHTLLTEVEQPLEFVLETMEYWGIRIDTHYLTTFSKQLETDLDNIAQQAYQAAGGEP
ncbi:MAG: DNA polymerase I, partial [Coleofasciculaceae cyanobacterium SM2_3_26]|nr:DNA polymerase I [Coleofasciculaceae cyanobacterium SM2_3_26]